MYLQQLDDIPPPPGVMGSLRAGFDLVSRHVRLILLPVCLDVLLWLGPCLSSEALLERADRPLPLPERMQEFQEFLQLQSGAADVTQHYNLFGFLSRLPLFPVGVSSLFAQQASLKTPLGSQPVIEVQSILALVSLVFLFIVVGWITGSLYFRWIAEIVLGNTQREAQTSLLQAVVQTLILSAIWMIGLIIVLLPIMILFWILLGIHPVLASGGMFLLLLLSFWLIVPLFFTPHGIFVRGQNALSSILTSLRMARFTLPTSGMFVVAVLLLTRGLNFLWNVPPNDSWMKLVGIGGHAFITTALLAASFVYYRDMNVWLQTVFAHLQQKQSMPTQQV